MQEYVVVKKEFDEAEHTVLKITNELGVSIVKMQDELGYTYDIALVKFTDLSDQYDLLDDKSFSTREKNKARAFVEGLIRTRKADKKVKEVTFRKD